MPLLIFLLKTIFGIFLITWAGKFLFWVFSTDTTTEEQDEISWLEDVRARPSLLIKPALFCIFLPIVSYLGIHHIITSQAAWAGEFRSFSIAAWCYLKWPLILASFSGVNNLIWWAFISNDHISKLDDWPEMLGMPFRIIWGFNSFILANGMMLWGTYYQLSPAHRLLVDGLLN